MVPARFDEQQRSPAARFDVAMALLALAAAAAALASLLTFNLIGTVAHALGSFIAHALGGFIGLALPIDPWSGDVAGCLPALFAQGCV